MPHSDARRPAWVGVVTFATLVVAWFALTTWTGAIGPGRFPSPAETLDALSRRELEVLNHLQLGLSNFQMAQRMSVTENAIKYHLKNIFSKLRARNRLEAIRIARDLGAIS